MLLLRQNSKTFVDHFSVQIAPNVQIFLDHPSCTALCIGKNIQFATSQAFVFHVDLSKAAKL